MDKWIILPAVFVVVSLEQLIICHWWYKMGGKVGIGGIKGGVGRFNI